MHLFYGNTFAQNGTLMTNVKDVYFYLEIVKKILYIGPVRRRRLHVRISEMHNPQPN